MPWSEELICQSVYEYLEANIVMGRFHTGDRLPSVTGIAEGFHLAPGTVRAALLRLAKDGYIRMEAKQGSWVAYQADRAERERENALYFARRQDGVRDLVRSGPCLMRPLITHALQKMGEDGWACLRENWGTPRGEQLIPSSVQFCAQVLSALENSLVLNLYWEVYRYTRFSGLSSWNPYGAVGPVLLEEGREEAAIQVESGLYGAMGAAGRELLAVCQRAGESFPEAGQVPFQWTIYRQRRQLCYTLAARIIRRIAAGVYPVGGFLPALPRMAAQLDVSLSTLRRTLSILGSLGVTRSLHGKGTLVCTAVEGIEFSRVEIKEGLRYYWESLQLLALTARPVTLCLLKTISEEDREALTRQFVQMCRLDRCHRCFDVTLTFIVERCPLALVRECYGKLQEYLAWGYPFTVYRLRNSSLQAEYAGAIRRAAGCLEERDWEGFAAEFEELMSRESRLAERVLSDFCT